MLTRLDSEMKDFVNRLHFFVRWGVQDDNDRANQAGRAPDLTQCTQFLVEEIHAQNRAVAVH